MVMELIGRKVSRKYILAVVVENKNESQDADGVEGGVQGAWTDEEPGEVMWVGQQREALNIGLDEKKIKQGVALCSLGNA